jgi:hypothetical protein
MITPPTSIQLWRTTEFTHHNHKGFIKQSDAVEVFDESGEADIEGRDQPDPLLSPAVSVSQLQHQIGMRIPPQIGDRYERNTALHKPSREQATLTERLPPVALSQVRRFFRQIECPLRLGRGGQAVGTFERGIRSQVSRFDFGLHRVKLPQKIATPAYAMIIDTRIVFEVSDSESRLRGVAAGNEGLTANP